MKIIKKGKKARTGQIWVGKTLVCQDCKCKFKLEEGDHVEFVHDQRDGDFYTVKCPDCNNTVSFYTSR